MVDSFQISTPQLSISYSGRKAFEVLPHAMNYVEKMTTDTKRDSRVGFQRMEVPTYAATD